jgi:hypothetical protein
MLAAQKLELLVNNFTDLLLGFAPAVLNPNGLEKMSKEQKLQSLFSIVAASALKFDPDAVCELSAKLLEQVNQHDLAAMVRNGTNELVTL